MTKTNLQPTPANIISTQEKLKQLLDSFSSSQNDSISIGQCDVDPYLIALRRYPETRGSVTITGFTINRDWFSTSLIDYFFDTLEQLNGVSTIIWHSSDVYVREYLAKRGYRAIPSERIALTWQKQK